MSQGLIQEWRNTDNPIHENKLLSRVSRSSIWLRFDRPKFSARNTDMRRDNQTWRLKFMCSHVTARYLLNCFVSCYPNCSNFRRNKISNTWHRWLALFSAESNAVVDATGARDEMIPIHTTAESQTTDSRSATPFSPLGIRRKSSLPIAFCAALKVQWSEATNCRSPLEVQSKTHKRHKVCITISSKLYSLKLYAFSRLTRILCIERCL